jgi:hypothetical protein
MVMLNPSTADERSNDPTVERCQRRALALGCGGLIVTNIFAYRSTDPAALYKLADPVGPDNNSNILQAASTPNALVICAWGRHGALKQRGAEVEQYLRGASVPLHVLALNDDGSPSHPLYLPYERQPQEWKA